MKKLVRSILMARNKPDPSKEVCNHKKVQISQQQINKSLIFLSKDHCKTCDQHMCNICSQSHIVDHCHLSCIFEESTGTLDKELKRILITGLKCICGKDIQMHNLNHAMCAACGLLSCSDECHHEWEKLGNFQHAKYPNGQYIEHSDFKTKKMVYFYLERTIAQKTSLSYISCYASKVTDYVYLQRGFRNYGRPQADIISRFQKVPFGLDYTTHIERLCDCSCKACHSREAHSVGNCEYECNKSLVQQVDSYQLKQQYHEQCKCTCAFCTSGVIVDTHRRLDCLAHCYKSELNNNQQMN